MEVMLTEAAREELFQLPRSIQTRVEKVLVRLGQWPEVSGSKWLTGDWKGRARIRTGDYRVIFHPDEAGNRIIVDRIAHRRDVYAD